MTKKFSILLLTLYFLISILSAERVITNKLPLISPDRPDIVVKRIKVTPQPSTKPGKVFLKIECWLSNNSSKKTRCCPTIAGKKAWSDSPSNEKLFRVSFYARSNSNGRFVEIGGTSTELNPYESNYRCQTFKHFDIGKTIQIRVVADPWNWINEKNENNNSKKTTWPARKTLLHKRL